MPPDQSEVEPEPIRDATTSLVSEAELDDTSERTTFDVVPLDASFFASPTVIGAFGGIVLGFSILLWPDRTDRILARIIGVAIVWLTIIVVAGALRRRESVGILSVVALGSLVVGGFLVSQPDQNSAFLGRLLGGAAIAVVLARLARARSNGAPRWWLPMPSSTVFLAVGALLLAFPESTLAAATVAGAIAWIVLSGIVIAASLDARAAGTVGYRSATAIVAEWLHERPKSADARQSLYDKILYEGPRTQLRVVRFFALMGFASVIAAMGVVTDSTAVVIGAMLIAPLMTPLMGMAISLVMGWPNRLTRSAMLAFGGIAFAIAVGVLIGLIVPAAIDTSTNTQIVARSAPTILDLIIALAAGVAGAYGLSRPDVSDSLPGVAIAIALVPPLAVVGISYSQGDWDSGNGALLLFTINMLAILVMGGLTFVITGVTPISRVAAGQHRVRTAVAAVVVLGSLVLGALFLDGAQAATNLFDQGTTEDAVDDWLADDDLHRLVNVSIEDDTVVAVVVGPSDGLPSPTILASTLSAELGRAVTVDVRLIVEERIVVTGD